MKTDSAASAKSNAMLDLKISEVESRLQRSRMTSHLRTKALQKGVRDSLTSPLALALAVATGFAAHRFDLLHRPKPAAAPTAEPSSTDSLLGGMIRGFTLAASLVALLPDSSTSGRSTPDAHA